MNNKILYIWGFILVLFFASTILLSIKYEEEIEYIVLKHDLKEATKKYIKDNNFTYPLEITSEELEEKEYINELKLNDKICAADILVEKRFLRKKYNISFECIKKEIN